MTEGTRLKSSLCRLWLLSGVWRRGSPQHLLGERPVVGLPRQVLSRSHARMRVWERGAGPTLACGTGACAVLVAGVLEGRLGRACRCPLGAQYSIACQCLHVCDTV